MNEFKGTKGKWEKLYIKTSSGGYYKIMSENVSVCNIITRNDEQAEANAKLIACAPEMLEMLKIMGDALLELMNHQDGWEDDYENLKQLIKKATEL